MIRYAYSGHYDPAGGLAAGERALYDVQIYAIAAKYDIPIPPTMTSNCFRKLAEEHWKEDWFAKAVCWAYDTTYPNDRAASAMY